MTYIYQHHYSWYKVPHTHKTEKQWLKLHRRVKKNAPPVGTITMIFDKARSRPKGVEAVSPEECAVIRSRLEEFGVTASDYGDLYRLDQAGQLAQPHLYDISDTDIITTFTEAEAEKLLGFMIWDNSHEDHYITEATVDGLRKRATWKSEYSIPDIMAHLSGERFYGVKKGDMTMQVAVDLDRHGGEVAGEEHIAKTLKVGEVLKKRFARYRFAPEINRKNGSVKFFGWLRDFTAMPDAEQVGEHVRSVLRQELPEYSFEEVEIYPSNSPQIFAPLRPDKVMVIGNGPVQKTRKYKCPKHNGKRKRHYYERYSCAAYLNWIYFSHKQYDTAVFETYLREAVARCPDVPVIEQVAEEKKVQKVPKTCKATKMVGTGMGDIGKLKGRCASALVKFWSELERPEDDTIGKYVIVTLRLLKYEGLTSAEAVDWIEDRLQALQYTAFSDRLTSDFAEIQRVMSYAVKNVWKNNGYQNDPELSAAKLKATVAAWSRRGFFLHDPATWHLHQSAVVPEYKLIWTPALLALIPDLMKVAHCDQPKAKAFMEKVLAFVEGHNELSESMVGNLLEAAGIKGLSRQKQHDVRKFLADKGLILKQKNYFHDKITGYKHGNFYICGLAVTFQEEEVTTTAHTTTQTTVSIDYLSFYGEQENGVTETWLDLMMECRRLACDERYRERLRRLNTLFSMAA